MENIENKFKEFEGGDVVNISWDRGNGFLDENYIFCGLKDKKPILAHYDSVKNKETPSFLDVTNPEMFLLDIKKINIGESEQKIVDSWHDGYLKGII